MLVISVTSKQDGIECLLFIEKKMFVCSVTIKLVECKFLPFYQHILLLECGFLPLKQHILLVVHILLVENDFCTL